MLPPRKVITGYTYVTKKESPNSVSQKTTKTCVRPSRISMTKSRSSPDFKMNDGNI